MRLRQVRMPPIDCPRIIDNYVNDDECLTGYSMRKEDDLSYMRGWNMTSANETGESRATLAR